MEAVRARQAEYDRLNDLPRLLPDRTWDEGAFAAALDHVQGDPSGAKRAAAQRLALVDAMARQKAQRRHGEWTKLVYEPIASEIARSVDAAFPVHCAARRAAHGDYLRASDAGGKATRTTSGHVFLDSTPGLGGAGAGPLNYNAFDLSARATVRTRVSVRDPLKALPDKAAREASLLKGVMGLHSSSAAIPPAPSSVGPRSPYGAVHKAPHRLPATSWTRGMLATLPFGHFEAAEERAGGVFNMAFAGKDNESSIRFCAYDPPHSYARDSRGRLVDVDAEFPRGIRTVLHGGIHHNGDGYVQHKAVAVTALNTVRHRVHGKVYMREDSVFSDGPLLDGVRTTVMKDAK